MSDVIFPNRLSRSLLSSALSESRLLALLDRFIFASLLALIVVVVIPYGTVEAWWISLYECAIFGLGALWVVEGLVIGAWHVQEKGLIAPVVLLALFTFLQSTTLLSSITLSADPFETRLIFLKLLAFVTNAALLFRYTSSPQRLRTLIHVVIGIALASALFGIVRQALQHNEAGFVLPYLRRDSGFGQFVNKNHFAFLMEMAIGLTTGLMFGGAAERKHFLPYLSAVALMWVGLVLTNSRGGLFSMLGQTLFLIVMFTWLRSKRRDESPRPKRNVVPVFALTIALSTCLLVVVAVGAIWIGGEVMVTRLASLPGEIKTDVPEARAGVRRREVWSATWQLIQAHPLTGSGFGAYGVAITKVHDGSGKWIPEAAHNDYLELLSSGGLVAVGLVTWFGCRFLKRARHQLCGAEPVRSAACLGALTGIFGVMAHSLVDFGLHVTANAVVFTALGVIATRDFGKET
jgi:O-antigen ligase